jgi:hypothetical protein
MPNGANCAGRALALCKADVGTKAVAATGRADIGIEAVAATGKPNSGTL